MRFAVVGEGLTDFKVLKNLLIGYFKDKNLPVTRLLPVDEEPVGWPNVLKFLTTKEFRDGVENTDYTIVQIDTGECQDWGEGLNNIGSDSSLIDNLIASVKTILINKIGQDFYNANNNKILFAITVNEIECWLLPFNTTTKAHFSKIVGCANAIEKLANKRGFSIHQKNYQDGKHYDELSKGMKKNKDLLSKGKLNPSLKIFIDVLDSSFDVNNPNDEEE